MKTLVKKITKIINDIEFNLGETAEDGTKKIMELPEMKAIQVEAKVIVQKGEMTANQAIDIMNATRLLAETFGEEHQEFLSTLCIFWKERMAILNEAITIKNKFLNADIVERGDMLGIKIHRSDGGGYETEEIVLSED